MLNKETKKLNRNILSENKDKFDLINLIFSLFIVCLPLVISFIHLLGLTFVNYDFLLCLFLFIWIVVFVAYLIKFSNKIDYKKYIKNPLLIYLY